MPETDSSSPAPSATPGASPPTHHTPGNLVPKLIYLGAGLITFGFGAAYLWEPLGRMLNGTTAEARVAEIRVVEPGQPDLIYNYRREYPPARNLSISFQHYVAIEMDNQPILFRLSVDSRKSPAASCNVNDTVRVAYYPKDPGRLAFAIEHARTWGAAAILCGVGLVMLMTAIPMVLTARKPIVIDPEAPSLP
ncbi:MAG: hypothetical protein K0R17_3693 [Rariglobus sp.]|jgi:hypothetical protein|nr:hypothetical protein [Rariglobus sp.]